MFSCYAAGMKRFTMSLALGFSVLASLVFAEDVAVDGWAAAVSGDYDKAVELGELAKTADGYVLAASALIAKILTLKSEDIKDTAKDARDYAKDALKLEPENAEALLQYAVAYGIVTRASSNFTVWRKKMPQKSLAAIQAAQTVSPDDARVDALIGSWHLGIVRKAGAERGADMFGANEGAGIAAFEQAVTRAPNDIVINMNYALSALALDPVKYGDRGEQILNTIAERSAQSDIDRVYLAWSKELSGLFDNADELQKRAAYYVDGE